MKSERAQKYLNSSKWKERETCPLENVRLYIAEEAVEMAEEDARGRAKNAFCRSKCLIAETCIKHAYYVCGELEKFLKTYDEQ